MEFKKYIGNMHDNIPNKEYNQGVYLMKYKKIS